jgi:hypothetical protein
MVMSQAGVLPIQTDGGDGLGAALATYATVLANACRNVREWKGHLFGMTRRSQPPRGRAQIARLCADPSGPPHAPGAAPERRFAIAAGGHVR